MALSLFKGPFESAGCTYENDGWVTTDLQRGERVKWLPGKRQALRWDVTENQWLPSTETRNQFLSIARHYQSTIRQQK